MKTFISTLIFSVVASSGATAFANADLQHMLHHPEMIPTRAQWIEAGAGAHGERLLEVAKDAKAQRYTRMRAASALSSFPEQKAKLAQLINDKGLVDAEVRIQALSAYTHVAGRDALPLLQKMSRAKNPELRAAAARNIVRIASPEAVRLARAFLQQEPEPWIRRSIAAALQRKTRN